MTFDSIKDVKLRKYVMSRCRKIYIYMIRDIFFINITFFQEKHLRTEIFFQQKFPDVMIILFKSSLSSDLFYVWYWFILWKIR